MVENHYRNLPNVQKSEITFWFFSAEESYMYHSGTVSNTSMKWIKYIFIFVEKEEQLKKWKACGGP